MATSLPITRGELIASGWKSRRIKEELRENLLKKLHNGDEIFPGIVGFDKTVIPQLVNAILSRHHIILLGLRGQAKTRILRQLSTLLDEQMPVLDGTLLNEDPLHPISPKGKALVERLGDKAPIRWMTRAERYHEKLATPDVSIADLIGDIDPIKAAREKLDISNEEVIHWGIIPRTNRGIFAINELPDLQPRILVGLLNILEEADIQVRGFPLRLPLDICMVFSANPEDYTNRGNIITPLKDRIDSQIITHYPKSRHEAKKITAAESRSTGADIPELVRDIIEEIAVQARASEFVDQASGVSARMSIAAYENVVANIERRSALQRTPSHARICDIYAALPAITGKIELVYEGEQEGASIVAHTLIGKAVNAVFLEHFPAPIKERQRKDVAPVENPYEAVTDYFSGGTQLEIADDLSDIEYRNRLTSLPGLKQIVERHANPTDDCEKFLRMELVLDGLYHNNVIARAVAEANIRYGDILNDMLKGM